jgi:hypothetical protein
MLHRIILVVLGAAALTACASSKTVPATGMASGQRAANADLISAGAGDELGEIMMRGAVPADTWRMQASAVPVH